MAGTEMSEGRPGQTRVVGDVEIEPIERIVVRVEQVLGGIAGVALKEPIAIVIRSPAGTWRVDLPPESGREAG